MTKEDWSAIASIVTQIDSAMRAPHSGFRDERMQEALKIARDRYDALANAPSPKGHSNDQ